VSVIYPDVEKLRKAFREELSPFEGTFQWEHFLHFGLDALFLCRVVGLDGTHRPSSASLYWRQLTYVFPYDGELRTPRNLRTVTIYSKHSFKYPRLYTSTRLPRYSLAPNESHRQLWLGFEDGSRGNIAGFNLYKSGTLDNVLYATVGRHRGPWQYNDVTSFRPADYDTAVHKYSVAVARNLIIFEIDERPVHFAVIGAGLPNAKVRENVPPYGVSLFPFTRHSLTFLLEQYVERSVETEDVVAPIAPYGLRIGEGSEVQPLSLQLYLDSSSTKMAGYSVSSGSVTSHPVPVYGYGNKTLLFMSDQSGTLSIQVYTLSGNWREYDSVTVSANKLLVYRMTGEALLARVVFTPSTYPTNILEAEAHMS